ncbi:MAG: PD40 domain-containing protein [Phycisphaerae bacterium]|nr:PD40 domain-containing protein [Phycisphaerae bacterium]
MLSKAGWLAATVLIIGGQYSLAQELTSLRIEGPTTVEEWSTTYYHAIAGFDQELEFDVTLFAQFSLEHGDFASIGSLGDLHTYAVTDVDVTEIIHAHFDFGDQSADASLGVTIQYHVTESGSSLDFDGVDDLVVVPAAAELGYSGTGGWTIEAWLWARDPDFENPVPVVAQVLAGSGRVPYALEVWDGQVHFRVGNAFGTIQRIAAPIGAEWTHVAGVYDPAEGIIRLHVNGLERDWQPISVLMESNASAPVIFGSMGGGQAGFDGRIDEVRLWRTTLSYCDIRGYMERALHGDEPGLAGYWRAEERSGQVVADSSPYGNDGVRGLSGATETSDPKSAASGADLSLGDFPPVKWTTPQLIPEVSSGEDWDVSISSDGLEMYIGSERDGFAQGDIYQASRTNPSETFATPVRVNEVSILGYNLHDYFPVVSGNGRRLYFSRKVGGGVSDLWVSERANRQTAWGAPVLISSLNTTSRDERITLTADELHCVFASDRSGAMRFWTASRNSVNDPWTSPHPIASLEGYSARSSTLTGDGRTLYFTAIGPSGSSNYDVWKSTRSSISAAFGPPVYQPDLSTPGPDLGIGVSQDGMDLYLVPNGSGGNGVVKHSRLAVPGQPVTGELDCDGDLDLVDFSEFAACLSGPDEDATIECTPADYDEDGDVDLADVVHFLTVLESFQSR